MNRLRHMDVDDKVCEQIDLALLLRLFPREVCFWDAHSGERLQVFEVHAYLTFFAVAWRKRTDLLVSGDNHGILRWWDVKRGQSLRVQEAHQGTVQALG